MLIIILYLVLMLGMLHRYHPTKKQKDSDWMHRLPPLTVVRDITWPGSHDSGSINTISFQSQHDETVFTQTLHKLQFLPFLTHKINRWTLAQSLSLADQLNIGIRCFDFRVTHNTTTQECFLVHSFTTITMLEGLNQIKDFMILHPSEVVILRYSSKSNVCDHLLVQHLHMLMLLSIYNPIRMSLEQLKSLDQRILLSCDHKPHDTLLDQFYHKKWVHHDFLDTFDMKQKIPYQLATIQSFQNQQNQLLNIDWAITPQQNDVLWNINSLEFYARQMNSQLPTFLSTLSDTNITQIGVVSADFVDSTFTHDVINMNFT
jgi:hypothetical protein